MTHDINALDQRQLETMRKFLKLRNKNTCTKQDVQLLKSYLDKIRQAMIQKTAGQRKNDPVANVDFNDLGTYINLAVLQSMTLYIYGGLDVLEQALKESEEK
jgi:hypothetical protein